MNKFLTVEPLVAVSVELRAASEFARRLADEIILDDVNAEQAKALRAQLLNNIQQAQTALQRIAFVNL